MPIILTHAGESNVERKRSRFLGVCAPVASEEEARAFLTRQRERYRDASHHVYAYGLDSAARTRHSDDGEPHGTAGLPVLNVFLKQGIINFVCVVTRYFGGMLLGTGGLVRAYTAAAQEALTAAEPAPLIRRVTYTVTVAYAAWDKFKYALEKSGLTVDRAEFTDRCAATITVPETHEEVFEEMTMGLEKRRFETL